jgi:capsular polysaccharide biosynthesis protein
MAVSRLDDAYCLPYAPPFLPASRRLATDFNIPWDAGAVGWFRHEGGNLYRLPIEMKLSSARSVDTGFFMGHLVSGHFGHFVGDCLSRMYAWKLCREIFGDVKLIVEHTRENTKFRDSLLHAAGANADDVIFSQGLFHCRKLLLASPSLGVSRYASPTSARLWQRIRDAFHEPPSSRADKIYLSRSGLPARRMTNEATVEDIFRSFGFSIIKPEGVSIEEQIAVISAARYVAGPGGSAMFNLAFQKRLKSVLVLTSETFVQTTELLFLAGADCSVYFHFGSRDMPDETPATVSDAWRADLSRLTIDIRDWLSGHS